MSKEVIEAFLQQMRERHAEEIEAIELPAGTREYLYGRIQEGDADALVFMLKLAYLMGLQTGYAAQDADESATPSTPRGPIEA